MSDDRKPLDEPREDDPARGMGGLDMVKRAVLTGMGALFMTEEGIRGFVGDMKLPKEALGFLMSQADKTRNEVARVVTQEMRRFLESDTLRREMMKLLGSMTLEVTASIKLKPNGEPDVSGTVRARRDKDKDEAEGGSKGDK